MTRPFFIVEDYGICQVGNHLELRFVLPCVHKVQVNPNFKTNNPYMLSAIGISLKNKTKQEVNDIQLEKTHIVQPSIFTNTYLPSIGSKTVA